MHQFQVPQFITIEDKVIGPFTIKQFLYVLTGVVIIGFTFYFFKMFVVIPVAVVVGSLMGALAFLKVNEQPFPTIMKNAIFYTIRPRLYVWRQEEIKKSPAPTEAKKPGATVQAIPKLSESKLTDLAWSLDIKEKLRE